MQYYRNACKPVSDWSYYAITLFPFKWAKFCLLLSRHHRSNDRLDLLDGKHKKKWTFKHEYSWSFYRYPKYYRLCMVENKVRYRESTKQLITDVYIILQ